MWLGASMFVCLSAFNLIEFWSCLCQKSGSKWCSIFNHTQHAITQIWIDCNELSLFELWLIPTVHEIWTFYRSMHHSARRAIYSSPPSAAYMYQWIWSSLVQIMACRLDGAKPLSEPMLTYSQLGHKEHNSVKYQSKFEHFHSRKCIWKCRLENGGHLVPASMC